MIAAVIFVLAFLVLGLGVIVFAFSGRAGARSRRGAPTRTGRRFIAVMVTVVIIALGVAVPLAIGVVNGNDHAKNAPGGVDLNAAQAHGRAVFGKYCSTCHTLKASNAVGKVGPNLDVLHPRRASSSTPSPRAARAGRARCRPAWSTARTPRTWRPTSPPSPAAGSPAPERLGRRRSGAAGIRLVAAATWAKIVLSARATRVRVTAVKTAEFPVLEPCCGTGKGGEAGDPQLGRIASSDA